RHQRRDADDHERSDERVREALLTRGQEAARRRLREQVQVQLAPAAACDRPDDEHEETHCDDRCEPGESLHEPVLDTTPGQAFGAEDRLRQVVRAHPAPPRLSPIPCRRPTRRTTHCAERVTSSENTSRLSARYTSDATSRLVAAP